MEQTNEYIEFAVTHSQRFEALQRVFDKLKRDKDEDNIDEDEPYLNLFDEEARQYFRGSTPEEDSAGAEKWYATRIEARWSDPSLQRGWDFDSMIDAFKNGEYVLLSCEMVSPTTARLNFYALAYPYGGTGCMQALVESFGFQVLMISDGGSPPHPP